MVKPIIYLNGKLVAAHEACLSPYDHGFLYGHGLFETMRAYRGKVFYLQAHLERLAHSMSLLHWPALPDDGKLEQAVDAVLAANQLLDASVRLTVSRGVGGTRPQPSTCGSPTVILFAGPFVTLSPESYEQGWSLATVSIRRNLTSPLCSVKSANYLDSVLARAEAQQLGAEEALLLNTDDMVAEGTMSNLFFVIQGKLVTPDRASGLLPGITRSVVLRLAEATGMAVEERSITPEEVALASEIFLTSSLLEIMPVTKLDRRWVNNGKPGPVTRQLSTAYKQLTDL
jgi:branched-chain amino acid aminotransferase group I